MSISNTFFRFVFAFSFFFISFALIAEPTLEEVVVSARKVDESVQDVPIAMSVFTSSDISDAGIEIPEDFIATKTPCDICFGIEGNWLQPACISLRSITQSIFETPS